MKHKTIQHFLFLFIIASLILGCKKNEESGKVIPEIYWEIPKAEEEYKKGENVDVIAFLTYTDEITSVTFSLRSPESDLNIVLHSASVNSIVAKIDFNFTIDSNVSESMLQINAEVKSAAGTNNFTRSLNILNSKDSASFGLVGILKSTYGKFNIQKFNSSLTPFGTPFTFDYEFESAIAANQNLYVSTIQAGGLVRINENMESKVLLDNSNSANPFIQSIASHSLGVYTSISTPSNQIIGFNLSDIESVRADLQLDICEDLLPVEDLMYSIERPTNGGSYIIANYNQRTGGYISSQNITRLKSEPQLFDFGNKKQVYFYSNFEGKVQIERLNQSDNSISIIAKIEGICLNQKPIKVSNNSVMIALTNKMTLFSEDHISSTPYSTTEQIKAVRMNSSKDRIAVLTSNSIILLNYPGFGQIATSDNVSHITDIQFID